MTLFNDIVLRSQIHFPEISVKYKDESLLMKILAKILFFNRDFMNYTTTLGSTIYFPSAAKIKSSPVSNTIIFLHEISHVYQSNKNSLLFKFLYLFPQILALLAIPSFIIFGWKIAIFFLLFLLPIPAYFRMIEEKRAYTMSLYVMNKLNAMYNYNIILETHKNSFVEEFKTSSYYFMWPFQSVMKDFNAALVEINAGGRPVCNKDLYTIIDNILER